jgi:hypothetical protein
MPLQLSVYGGGLHAQSETGKSAGTLSWSGMAVSPICLAAKVKTSYQASMTRRVPTGSTLVKTTAATSLSRSTHQYVFYEYKSRAHKSADQMAQLNFDPAIRKSGKVDPATTHGYGGGLHAQSETGKSAGTLSWSGMAVSLPRTRPP